MKHSSFHSQSQLISSPLCSLPKILDAYTINNTCAYVHDFTSVIPTNQYQQSSHFNTWGASSFRYSYWLSNISLLCCIISFNQPLLMDFWVVFSLFHYNVLITTLYIWNFVHVWMNISVRLKPSSWLAGLMNVFCRFFTAKVLSTKVASIYTAPNIMWEGLFPQILLRMCHQMCRSLPI